jgi:Protein of unknown function (DUF4239)
MQQKGKNSTRSKLCKNSVAMHGPALVGMSMIGIMYASQICVVNSFSAPYLISNGGFIPGIYQNDKIPVGKGIHGGSTQQTCGMLRRQRAIPIRSLRISSKLQSITQLYLNFLNNNNLSQKKQKWNDISFITKLYDATSPFSDPPPGDFVRTTTESIGTDYIPLEVTCDPNFYLPEAIDSQDVPGYTGYDRERFLNLLIPALSPLVAFITFDLVAGAYSSFVDVLDTSKTWVAVDGGAFQAKIMTPAINGLVVPAMALLFATLTSTTITTLRQRQVDVRSSINMESGELRALECLVDSFDAGTCEQDLSRDYLIQYTSRVLAECHPKIGSGENVINPRRGMDSELNGLTALINKSYGKVIPPHVADECNVCIARLREQRTKRISALQSVYPFLHYVILVVLAIGECVAFLMETDQDILVFLNAIQIKILWSMLIGTFVTCFQVFKDLRSPFSGSYQISASVGQLHTIKLTLQASKQLSMRQLEQELKEQSLRAQQFLNFNGGGNLTVGTSTTDTSSSLSSMSIHANGAYAETNVTDIPSIPNGSNSTNGSYEKRNGKFINALMLDGRL